MLVSASLLLYQATWDFFVVLFSQMYYIKVCALLMEAGMWINSKGPNETFCSRESWLSGLVSKAKCFFRNRYKDNLSQLPFSHAFPFRFTC